MSKKKVKITRYEFFAILLVAGIIAGASFLLLSVYLIAPNSPAFFSIFAVCLGVIIFLFVPGSAFQRLIAPYISKPKNIRIRGDKEQLDRIAMEKLEIQPDYIKINSQYMKTLFIEKYPPEIWDGWAAPIASSTENIGFVMHVHPTPTDKTISRLDLEIAKVDSGIMAMGATDPRAVPLVHLSDALKDYREKLVTGRSSPFDVSVYLTAKGETKKELNDVVKEITSYFKGRRFVLNTPRLNIKKFLYSVMPFGKDPAAKHQLFDTQALKTIMPFTKSTFGTKEGVLLGCMPDGHRVIFSPFEMRVPHGSILGATRSGKSYLLKYFIARLFLYYLDTRLFIVDTTPLPFGVSEFTPLMLKLGQQIIRFGEREKDAPMINPFDIRLVSPKSKTPLRDKILKVSAFLDMILVPTPHEHAVLENVLPKVYAEKGITDDLNLPTFEGDSPIFSDLQAGLKKFAASEEATAQDRIICDKYTTILQPWVNSPFNRQTKISLASRGILIDISTLRGTPMFAPAAFLIMEFIYSQVVQTAGPKIVVFDECHLIMDAESMRKELARFVSEFGKYGAGVIVSSQSAEDFLKYSEGRKILDNTPLTILMKHENISEEMQKRWKFTPAETDTILRAKTGAEGFGYSEGLVIAENSRAKVLFISDPHEHSVITTKPEELQELAKTYER